MRALVALLLLAACSGSVESDAPDGVSNAQEQQSANCEPVGDERCAAGVCGRQYHCATTPARGTLPGECEAYREDPEHELFCWTSNAPGTAISPLCHEAYTASYVCRGGVCSTDFECLREPKTDAELRPGVACEATGGNRYRCEWQGPR